MDFRVPTERKPWKLPMRAGGAFLNQENSHSLTSFVHRVAFNPNRSKVIILVRSSCALPPRGTARRAGRVDPKLRAD